MTERGGEYVALDWDTARAAALVDAGHRRPLVAPTIVTCPRCNGWGFYENEADLAMVARGLPRGDVAKDECHVCDGAGRVLVGCLACNGGYDPALVDALCFWCDAAAQGPAWPDPPSSSRRSGQ